MTMHEPMLLTDEQCQEVAETTNRSLDQLLTMFAPAGLPTPYADDCPEWLGRNMAFNAHDIRSIMTSTGAYSDYRA